MKRRMILGLLAMGTLLPLGAQNAQTFRSRPVRIPGGTNVFVYGINDLGVMVANYTDTAGSSHCATINGSTITEIADPKAVGTGSGAGTSCFGINNSGQVTGSYTNGVFSNGFLYTGGQFVDIIVPSATAGTVAVGLNNTGSVAGFYADDAGSHGFLYVVQTNSYGKLDLPGAIATLGIDINDSGVMTIQWLDASSLRHGATFQNGTYTVLDVPGAAQSAAEGINAQGQIVFRGIDAAGAGHAFLYSNGVFTEFSVANAADTHGFGINSSTQISGAYNPSRNSSAQVGFEGHF